MGFEDELPTKVVSEIGAEYDYIIAGGGAAGCVLASRLTEDPKVTVLVLEAGGDDVGYRETYIPALGGFSRLPIHDWKYLPVPQKKACKGMKDNRPIWSCGKCLGGGGSVNYLMWMRGVPGDFDLWEQMGCDGWGYKDVLPYFLKSENMATERLAKNGYHASGGPITVSEYGWVSSIGKAFLDSAKDDGYRHVDCNSADPFGFMVTQSNIGNGVRGSMSRAFLRPAMERKNLHIAINTLVTKVMLEGKTAVGLYALRDGKEISVRARKEVILSAGCIQSPKILMLSGIGPRDHLKSLGIGLVHDLPVGDLLTDHVAVLWPSYSVDKPISMNEDLLNSKEVKDLWANKGTGPLASSCTVEATGYVQHNRDENAALQVADIEYLCISGTQLLTKPGDEVFNVEDEMYKTIYDLPSEAHGFTIYIFLSHPKSTGTLRLRSTDPNDTPLIDPNYLAEDKDLEDFVKGMKIAMKFCKSKHFQEIGTRLLQKGALPGFKVGDEESDAYIREMARTLNNTTYHYIGTCKMGANDDLTAVVDTQLRVRGIKNLRVVDSGVMPEQTSGNLHCPTIMIAEKAADMIKGKKLPPADLKAAAAAYKAWKKE